MHTNKISTRKGEKQTMIKKIKEKLREPFFVEDLLIDYVRPAVMGLIGAVIGIAISHAIGLL